MTSRRYCTSSTPVYTRPRPTHYESDRPGPGDAVRYVSGRGVRGGSSCWAPAGLPVISEHAESPGHRNVRHRQVRCPPGTGERGHRVVDTDTDQWSHWVTSPDGSPDWIWREDAIAALLASHRHGHLFVAGCKTNQGKLYPRFDHIALLSAPADVLLARIAARTSNPYGKHPAERALILRDLAEVEPRL